MIGTAGAALGVAAIVRRRASIDPAVAVALVIGVLLAPLQAMALTFLLWSIGRFRRAAAQARGRRAEDEAVLEGGELIALGLAGGLSVGAACRVASRHCSPEASRTFRALDDAMRRRGVVSALIGDRGTSSALSAVLATATASGAPVLPALEAHLEHEHHRRHTAAVERARRLPIRLLVPLTLLVLPGFVLITVGPALVDSLARLSP